MKASLHILFWLLMAAQSTSVLAQSGGGYDLRWNTLGGGGGPSAGGSFTLNGTIGQADAGTMSGASFVLSGGFWGGIVGIIGPVPALSIRLVSGNDVILTWPNPSTGYVLQQTANMSAPGGGWTDVTQTPVINGANKEVTLAATGAFCMFRLRQP
jgi:hypothetical protein